MRRYRSDRAALIAPAEDPQTDLAAPLPHGPDYTVVPEMLAVADHSAYHLGESSLMREVMGT